MVKRVGYFVLFLIVFNFAEHFAHKKTDGFSLHRIQFAEPLTQENSLTIPELNQPFHYLDCGNQCYAFLSEDGNYVLKFFKYANPPIPPFLTKIPVLNTFKPFRPHRLDKTAWKQKRDLQGYKLAYDFFKEESGLIAVHLTPTDQNLPTITLSDKLNCVHKLDLNRTPFVLQRSATPIYKQLRAWIAAGKNQEAKQAVAALITLLKKRISLNLLDDDVNLYSNFGFIGHEAIQIDPGHFIQGTSSDPDLEMKTILEPLVTWCDKHAPELLHD